MGFGGTLPLSYILWLRSMAAIGLMHLVFARSEAKAPELEVATEPTDVGHRALIVSDGGGHLLPRFPNVMT
jgi:hypothetical protein